MAYGTQDAVDKVSAADAMIALFTQQGFDVLFSEEYISHSQPSKRLIVQLDPITFLRLDFQRARLGNDSRIYDTLNMYAGTGYTSGSSLDNQSPLMGTPEQSSASSHQRQYLSYPCTMHLATNPDTREFALCFENHSDDTGRLFAGVHAEMKTSAPYNDVQWYFDGVTVYNQSNGAARFSFHQSASATWNTSQAGKLLDRQPDGVTANWYNYPGGQSWTGYDWASGWGSIGATSGTFMGWYSNIWQNIKFEPSLTSYFLPVLLIYSNNVGSNFDNLKIIKGECPHMRYCNMLYLGIGQEVIMNGQRWRTFPGYGAGGTNTHGYAFLEGPE
ncbi:hypothetical protein [Vibrio phage VpKK5]|uniref:structural protein n=1 Tax=Vibrio phage VpKK5 TaxID=1538804 RepID=UPI0004F8B5D0|nr:structural protein [Vibrio phage VpKK5]AIM40629.1 hypothetical protein [Vibrio phage VpKK5]